MFVLANSNVADSASMLLERCFHDLCLRSDLPDSDLSLHTSRDDSLAVVGESESSDSMVVSIVDDIEQLSGLRKEGSDLAIVPARHDAFAVSHEVDAEALQSGNLDSEKLLPCLRVPHSNVIFRAGGEYH